MASRRTEDGALSHGFCCQWPEELSHALYPRLLLISAVLAVSSSPRSTAERGRKRPMPTHRAGTVIARVFLGAGEAPMFSGAARVVRDWWMGLTRFGGHPESLARGPADAKNTSTIFAGVSPTDGRPRPCWT
jgi:hypothetical protein